MKFLLRTWTKIVKAIFMKFFPKNTPVRDANSSAFLKICLIKLFCSPEYYEGKDQMLLMISGINSAIFHS